MEAAKESLEKLADHWRAEAERQCAISKAAGAVETLARLAALEVGRWI